MNLKPPNFSSMNSIFRKKPLRFKKSSESAENFSNKLILLPHSVKLQDFLHFYLSKCLYYILSPVNREIIFQCISPELLTF
jgi:hypothetical protein